MTTSITNDDHVDDHADATISECLSLTQPRSFFLFAAAGSGKTRSLVNAANHLRGHHGDQMRLLGQRVGIITYTKAARDEIKGRLSFDPLFNVSTIPSFVWELISGFNSDIRVWLDANLREEIAELNVQQATGRPGNASDERRRKIEQKGQRLATLRNIKRFVYSPTGDNTTRDSLNHAEVIKIGSAFLKGKPLLQTVLVYRFPFLLVDESQDTNGALMDALFAVQATQAQFTLGLFGDMMQRIYADGKVDLGRNLPADWRTPAKVMNHRSPKRVIDLINKIRSAVEDRPQRARSDAFEGHVRLFVSRTNRTDMEAAEAQARERMAAIAADPAWRDVSSVKTLILEHHMAARRMGFAEMFMALNPVSAYQTGLRDGTLPVVRVFSTQVLSLVRALRKNDKFAVATVLRNYSPLLQQETLKSADVPSQLSKARDAVGALAQLTAAGQAPTFGEVLNLISDTGLFVVPDVLIPFCGPRNEGIASEAAVEDEEHADKSLTAIAEFLKVPFGQVEPYAEYVSGNAPFDTHQGVKGREFPRVLAIIDDEAARGFMFSHDTLFGAKTPSARSPSSANPDGKESSIDRTRRLFYVICSRSQQSLAIVAYSSSPAAVRSHALTAGWFAQNEVEVLS